MLQTQDKIPAFQVENQEGKLISSSDFLGKKYIIFFYPQANTPGCTEEACNLSEHYPDFIEEGYTILGISPDTISKQKKFHEKYQLKFDLLADEKTKIAQLFGVWQLKKFMGKEFMGVVRTTFVFDERSICTKVITKVDTKNASKQLMGDE